ncbi:AraC family transcriptional regulator [Sorangium sp. So ce385]|uniref:AraC family transcriptional regulator n=1 Tax=Sorangium sp. So ce385 TaxID=3133308 RepID=UPI003F5C4427
MSDISVKVFQAIVAGAAAEGVAPADLLAAAGVDPADLADPDRRFPRAVEARLWCEAARLLRDDGFGLRLAERLPVGGLGALGFAVRSSATVGEAYARAARYLRVVASGPSLEIRTDGDVARLRHEPPRSGPSPSRHAVEFFLGTLVVLARRGADPAFTPAAARFRHAAPARLDEHRRLFGASLRFGEAQDELVFERAFLARPQAHAEPALCEVLDQHLASLAAALPAEASFLDRARAAIAAELAHGEPALPAIAARLRMSPRSVQRRLKEEGTSLSALLDRLRADLAVRYLSESRDSISEVAFLLGFSEVSTFHRAFKRWTGVTPAAYRRGAGGARRGPDRAAPRHSSNSAS